MTHRRRPLLGDLQHAHAGDPWHGPSRATILSGITARQAAVRAGAGAHSIWELVLHMTTWTEEVGRRLRDGVARLPERGDWPPVTDTSDAAWTRALAELDAAHADLIRALEAFPEERLAEKVGGDRDAPLGSGVSYAAMLRGLAQHDAYHSGQIAVLKKLGA